MCLFKSKHLSSVLSALVDIFRHLSLVSRSTRMFIHQHLYWLHHLFGCKVIYLPVMSPDMAVSVCSLSLQKLLHFNWCFFCYFVLFFRSISMKLSTKPSVIQQDCQNDWQQAVSHWQFKTRIIETLQQKQKHWQGNGSGWEVIAVSRSHRCILNTFSKLTNLFFVTCY